MAQHRIVQWRATLFLRFVLHYPLRTRTALLWRLILLQPQKPRKLFRLRFRYFPSAVEPPRRVQFFRCDSACLGFVKDKGTPPQRNLCARCGRAKKARVLSSRRQMCCTCMRSSRFGYAVAACGSSCTRYIYAIVSRVLRSFCIDSILRRKPFGCCVSAGQCQPCQIGSYALDGGGKECTACPSTGFCPGTL